MTKQKTINVLDYDECDLPCNCGVNLWLGFETKEKFLDFLKLLHDNNYKFKDCINEA